MVQEGDGGLAEFFDEESDDEKAEREAEDSEDGDWGAGRGEGAEELCGVETLDVGVTV